jgi:hypothetical protein
MTTEVHDAETAQLLKDLQEEGETVETTKEEVETETPEVLSQEVETKEEAVEVEPEVETQPVDRVPKEPSLMPAWEHKVAQKKWEQEREQLTQELEAMKANPTPANRENVAQTARNVREMAQQFGLELDDRQEQFFQTLVSNTAVPEHLTRELEALKQDRQIAYLETQYENEFLKDVAPLVPETQHAELRQKLHDLAFSEQYAKVPLKKVFLAEQDTLNVIPSQRKVSMDTTKQGKSRTVLTDYSNLSEADVEKLSPEEFEKYADSLEGKSKWRK